MPSFKSRQHHHHKDADRDKTREEQQGLRVVAGGGTFIGAELVNGPTTTHEPQFKPKDQIASNLLHRDKAGRHAIGKGEKRMEAGAQVKYLRVGEVD